jgi:hypothetical protein
MYYLVHFCGDPAKRGTASQEELARFLAAPVPRTLTRGIKHAAVGGVPAFINTFLFGAFLFCIASLFASIFTPKNILDDWALEKRGISIHGATVVKVEETNFAEGRQAFAKTIYRFIFAFRTQNGEAVTAECFFKGAAWTENQRVSVRYLPENPKVAHIIGARRDKFSGFFGVFPLVLSTLGLGIMFIPLWNRRRRLRLLVNGKIKDFKILSQEATSASVNEARVYKITLQAKDLLSSPPVVIKTHEAREIRFLADREKRGEYVFGLFDPSKPKRIFLPEAWTIKAR